jgi:hypothetical protein
VAGTAAVPEQEREGLTHNDLLWLIDRVPAEIMLLRPARDDMRRISAAVVGREV